jgi:AraC-like DNA-binding protein
LVRITSILAGSAPHVLAQRASALDERANGVSSRRRACLAGNQGVREVATWSTDAVKSSERFTLWHEVVCHTVLNVSTEARPEHFQARISGWSAGALRFAAFESTSHAIVRGREHLARAPADHYLVSLQRRGVSHITQDDDQFRLDPGEVAILDGQRPFRVAFPASVSRSIAVVPRKSLEIRAPWLTRTPVRKIAAGSPFADLIRHHLVELADCDRVLNEGEASVLTENLCNLLALATARRVAATASHPDLQLEALLAFCRRNIGDPSLSPAIVATQFGISLRTLHLRFERLGQTFGRWVLDNRLDGCARALRDPRQADCKISEFAYRWGFNDLSHFNRAFRARFAMTPRDWQNGAKSGGDGL